MVLRSLVGRYFSNLTLISTGKLLRLEFIVKLSDLVLLLITDLWNKVKMKNHVTKNFFLIWILIMNGNDKVDWTCWLLLYLIWFTSRWSYWLIYGYIYLLNYCNNNESKFFFSMVSFTSLNTILMLLVSTATVKWWYSGAIFFSLFFFLKLLNRCYFVYTLLFIYKCTFVKIKSRRAGTFWHLRHY